MMSRVLAALTVALACWGGGAMGIEDGDSRTYPLFDRPDCRALNSRPSVPQSCTAGGVACMVTHFAPSGLQCMSDQPLSDTFPSEPHNVSVDAFIASARNENLYAGLNISWSPPRDASFDEVSGFLLTVRVVDGTPPKVYCRLFNISKESWKQHTVIEAQKQVRFNFDCLYGLPMGRLHHVQIASLPMATQQQYQKQTSMFIRTPTHLELWNTVVRYRFARENDENIIEVAFDQYPDHRLVASYRVSLYNTVTQEVVTVQPVVEAHQGEKMLKVKFVYDGCLKNHTIRIQPDNTGFRGDCLCKDSQHTCPADHRCPEIATAVHDALCAYIETTPTLTPGGSTSTGPARTPLLTTTRNAGVTTSPPSSTGKESAVPTTIAPAPMSSMATYADQAKLAAISVGVVLGVLLVAMLLALILRCQIKVSEHWKKLCPIWRSKPEHPEPPIRLPSRKSVLLVYSHDHPYHVTVVEKFALFLKESCSCDVILDQWSVADICELTFGVWRSQKMRTADYIIVISSEAGYRMYTEFSSGISYESRALEDGKQGPPDVFVQSLREMTKLVLCQPEVYAEGIILVSFDYSKRDYGDILGFRWGQTFQMMKDIEGLVLRLHKIRNSGSLNQVQGINQLQYVQRPQGAPLAAAIKRMDDFVKENPDWFEKSFLKVFQKDSGFDDISLVPPSDLDGAEHDTVWCVEAIKKLNDDDNSVLGDVLWCPRMSR